MELEDQKKIEMELENIIQIESSLIRAKYTKIQQDEESERHKNALEKSIKSAYYDIAHVKRQALLRQINREWTQDDEILCEMESEQEFQRWKSFTPEEKIKEHKGKINMLQEQSKSNDEDWEPMTDIAMNRLLKKEIEAEMARLEKLEALRQNRKN